MKRKNVAILAIIMLLLTTSIGFAGLSDGLVAYYPFNGNANDESGNGNHGTVNGATLTLDRNGNVDSAYYFNGVSDFIQIPGAPFNLDTSDVTLSAWIIANTMTMGGHGIISKRDGAIAWSAGYTMEVDGDVQKVNSTIGDGSGSKAIFRSSNTVTDGQWHMVTAVSDRDGYGQIYIDGVPDGTATSISHRSDSMDNGYDLLIGQTIASYGEPGYFLGAIDEVRIYNRALTADEVSQLFNLPPVADAGPDQAVYAWDDGIAEVTLDGSGSYDPDGDELTYQWTWTIDGDIYNAEGISPTIELPVGVHPIELVVNDGSIDSEPDEVVITVVEPMEAQLWIFPATIHRHRGFPEITAVVRLPEGITKDQIDIGQPLLLYPGGIEAMCQGAIQWCGWGIPRTSIIAFFSKADLMDAVPDNGYSELFVVGQLNTGQYFYGSDFVRIVSWCWWRPIW